ncbi:MAG: hypothetical protein LBP50_00115 [Tannerella sp.]|jgi:hypothetical protein|nr:hypothetical protein [Tannerella sp.]
MKKIFLILGMVCWAFQWGAAQTKNVDVDNLWFLYACREHPTHPRDPVHFAYATRIHASSSAKNNLRMEGLQQALQIEGQVWTADESEAQMLLEVTLGDVVIKSSDVNERKAEVKDRAGKVTATNYYYTAVVVYTFEASCRILAGDEEVTKGTFFSRSSNQIYTSEEYTNRKSASDYWTNNREVLISGFYTRHAMEAARKVSEFASSHFGFPAKKNLRYAIKTIDEQKHVENMSFRSAAETLKALLQSATPDELPDRARMGDLVDYFRTIPFKYADPKLKADIRLRYAAYYNLCALYYYMDQPEKVAEYADLLIANGHDPKDGERMKKDAAALLAQFDKTGIRTRHFDPESYFRDN